jgi:hypothetical protein
VVVLSDGFVKRFEVSDVHLTLPFFGCIQGISIIIQQEGHLHSRSINFAGLTFSRSSWLTTQTAKNGKR